MSTTDMATLDEEGVIIQHIIILMPFEGMDTTMNQLFKLIYRRLKHIIEKQINEDTTDPVTSDGKPCKFRVNVFLAVTGNIKDEALRTIRDSDIAIGFVCDTNVTVVYELAVRNLLRPELILIVDSHKGEEPSSLLPFYLRDYAYIVPTFAWTTDEALKKLAKAESANPVKDFNAGKTPELLVAMSNQYDADIRTSIKNALQSFVDSKYMRQNSILNVMQDLDPEKMVSNAASYYPSSVMKYVWRPRRKDKKRIDEYLPYEPADIRDSFVCDYNYRFLELFNLNEINRARPLRDEMIFKQLEKIVDKSDLSEFADDQGKLTQEIVFGEYFGLARIPIRFNNRHPDERFRNRAYLPCAVLKKRIGNPDMFHFLYLLVIFFDVTDADNYKVYHYGEGLEKATELAKPEKAIAPLAPETTVSKRAPSDG